MKKVRIAKLGVFHGGESLGIGHEMELDNVSADALIASGHAEEINDAVEDAGSGETGEGNQTPGEGQEGGQMTPGQGDNNGQEGVDPEAELKKARKALDSQYHRDDLYEAAIKAGVDIAYDTKKADIIEAVITQGKKDALLK